MFRIFFIFFILAFPLRSWALIEVDITRGNLNPLPIAVSPLSIDNASKQNFEKILKKKNIGSDISSVIDASEPGAESSMANTVISIESINSDDGETFDDLFEKAKEVPHIQEIVAVSLALILGLFLMVNGRRNSKRRKRERQEHINRLRADRFVSDGNSMFGGPPPQF